MQDIPLFLFTGFLEAGKTKFIQETLEDERFNEGEETLVILCEEGELELDLKKIGGSNIHVEVIDDENLINPVNLSNLVKKHNAERVLVEWNGMWMLDKLFEALPPEWIIYQEYCFADFRTFISYNQNMRQLVFDKIKTCDAIILNRYTDGLDYMPHHKIIRAINRRCDIFYEKEDGDALSDDMEDPLPFDKNADVIKIEEKDYAYWYRDLDENMKDYEGKTVEVMGLAGYTKYLTGGDFVFGRQLMTCCEADTRMAGLACEWNGPRPEQGRWFTITARIEIKKNKAYGGKQGPVLIVSKINSCNAPEYPVATFY